MPGQVNVKIAWTRPGGGAAPTITSPAFLVAGTVDTVYPTTTFTASGTAPITWSVTAGTLPAGMAFSSAGVLSGTPTATASGSITFTATNAYGSANTSLTLTVNAAGTQPLLQPSDITYLGYYDLNLGIGDPFYGTTIAVRYVGGQPRMIISIFPGNGSTTRTIAEVDIAGASLNSTITSTVNTWSVDCTQGGTQPVWEYGWSGQGPTYGACESILWDSTNNYLLRSSFIGYPQAGVLNQAWLDVLSVPSSGGAITRVKRLNVGASLMDTRIGGGFSEIPSTFQSTYGVGPIALGTGCYTSLVANYPGGAPMGFTTYAVPNYSGYSNGSTLPITTMASHDALSGTTNLGKKMWFGYTFTQTGTKTFTSTEVNAPGGNPAYNGVTVPTGTFTSAAAVVGPVDYLYSASDPRGNGQTGPQPTWDPVYINSAGNGTAYGNIGGDQTWFAWNDYYGGHAFIYGASFTKRGVIAVGLFTGGALWYSNSAVANQNKHLEMHIFDPDHLGQVVQGSRAAKDVQPTSYKLVTDAPVQSAANDTGLPCVSWDSTAKKLYVSWPTVYSGSYKTRVLVYSVNV